MGNCGPQPIILNRFFLSKMCLVNGLLNYAIKCWQWSEWILILLNRNPGISLIILTSPLMTDGKLWAPTDHLKSLLYFMRYEVWSPQFTRHCQPSLSQTHLLRLVIDRRFAVDHFKQAVGCHARYTQKTEYREHMYSILVLNRDTRRELFCCKSLSNCWILES